MYESCNFHSVRKNLPLYCKKEIFTLEKTSKGDKTLFTMLGNLGNKEGTLKGIINRKYNGIFEKRYNKNRFPIQLKEMYQSDFEICIK